MANNIQARFISADDHIDLRWLPKDLWIERLPPGLRERGPRVVETDKGECWTWEGQTFSRTATIRRRKGAAPCGRSSAAA